MDGWLMALLVVAVALVSLFVGYKWGARAVQTVKTERDELKGKILRVAQMGENEFLNWKGRVLSAKNSLSGK